MALKIHKNSFGMRVPVMLLAGVLAGCWVPPRADVQPKGPARLIQEGIPVVVDKDDVTIQSFDVVQNVLVLAFADGLTATVKPDPSVIDLSKIRAGAKAKVKVAQELSVYVLINGQMPGADGQPKPVRTDARVLEVDRAYRLLTLQYANRSIEVLKVGLDTKMFEMEPGDSVMIETKELRALKVRKP